MIRQECPSVEREFGAAYNGALQSNVLRPLESVESVSLRTGGWLTLWDDGVGAAAGRPR